LQVKKTVVKTTLAPEHKAVAPVAPAGEDEKKALEDAGVEVPKKRTTRSTKE
jgi:calnexin